MSLLLEEVPEVVMSERMGIEREEAGLLTKHPLFLRVFAQLLEIVLIDSRITFVLKIRNFDLDDPVRVANDQVSLVQCNHIQNRFAILIQGLDLLFDHVLHVLLWLVLVERDTLYLRISFHVCMINGYSALVLVVG